MSKESCNICCDSYNKSSREKICCGYCDFPSCKTCCETYILSETIPKCMNTTCAKEWSRKFIREKFTNAFINTKFKNHLEELLFDQEKALMPATQPIVEERIRKENIKKEMTVLDNLIQDLYLQKRQLERNLYTNITDTSSKQVSNYVRACSSSDCRGFLSSQWKCGICEQWTCPECHELKGANRDCEHTCNPDLVETAKLLAKDTKSCPTCQTKIFKIDGCFSENTPIMLWDGTTKMSQDIEVGDVLVGDDGKKRIVEDLVTGQDEMYEIRQNNGMNYTVNSKHTLVLKDNNDDIKLIIIDDYLLLDNFTRSNLFGYKIINSQILKTSIEVLPIGKGQYYGWSLSEQQNRRFLLPDFTVVKNCDQMWCTQCHTAFSWKTGAIQTSIHNPHYYEWQRKNGGAPRVAGDVECGRELNHITFDHLKNAILRGKHVRFLKYYDPNSLHGYDWNARNQTLNDNVIYISDIIRRTTHNERIELQQFRTGHLEKNQELRVQYLCNEIDEDIFKNLVQRNDKKHRKNNEISQVIQVSITAVTDIVFRIIDNFKNSKTGEDKFDELMSEFNGVREYCNEIFKDISFAYGCVQYGFDHYFNLRTIQKEKKAKKIKEEEETNSVV